MNSSFPRTWIALLLDFFASFRCEDSVCKFRMMAARPRTTFTHTKAVQLIVEEGMDVNTIETEWSLPDFKEEITGIVPNFGGECFDIMLRFTDTATHLATSGFDYGAERKALKLLGARTIHLLVFVAVEYPNQDIVNCLKQYGQLKSENLDRVDHTFLCRTLECFSFGPSFFAVNFHPIPWRVHENYSQWLFNRETFSEERSETG